MGIAVGILFVVDGSESHLQQADASVVPREQAGAKQAKHVWAMGLPRWLS